MKKLGLGLVALAIVAGVYYFSVGSEKLAVAMKTQMSTEFATLKNQGFTVETKEVSKDEEHFEISFSEPEKIAAYLSQKGVAISTKDAQELKGLTIGIDVHYLPDMYSSVSFDMYPLTLPAALTDTATDPEEEKLVVQIKDMLARKVFLAHVDINKLGSGFKGYIKDFNETIQGEEKLTLSMKDFTFKGTLEDEKLTALSHKLKTISLSVGHDMLVVLSGISSEYDLSGPSDFDYSSSHAIDAIETNIANQLIFHLKGAKVSSDTKVDNGLAEMTLTSNVKEMQYKAKGQDIAFKSLNIDMLIDNLPIASIKKLETMDPNNQVDTQAEIKKFLSQGLTFNINDFSVKTLNLEGKDIDGFTMNTGIKVKKNFDILAVQKSPMSALPAIDANLKVTLSDALYAFIAKQPKAAMAMMFLRPVDVNGQKVYEAELKDGKVTLNGNPMM